MTYEVDTSNTSISDPNPRESAEFSLTLLTRPEQEVDGDAIGAEMVELYDHNASFGLFCRVLDELENRNQSVIYVGSRSKCEHWSEIFMGMGIQAVIEEI